MAAATARLSFGGMSRPRSSRNTLRRPMRTARVPATSVTRRVDAQTQAGISRTAGSTAGLPLMRSPDYLHPLETEPFVQSILPAPGSGTTRVTASVPPTPTESRLWSAAGVFDSIQAALQMPRRLCSKVTGFGGTRHPEWPTGSRLPAMRCIDFARWTTRNWGVWRGVTPIGQYPSGPETAGGSRRPYPVMPMDSSPVSGGLGEGVTAGLPSITRGSPVSRRLRLVVVRGPEAPGAFEPGGGRCGAALRGDLGLAILNG